MRPVAVEIISDDFSIENSSHASSDRARCDKRNEHDGGEQNEEDHGHQAGHLSVLG